MAENAHLEESYPRYLNKRIRRLDSMDYRSNIFTEFNSSLLGNAKDAFLRKQTVLDPKTKYSQMSQFATPNLHSQHTVINEPIVEERRRGHNRS